jgi:hypothetical protein
MNSEDRSKFAALVMEKIRELLDSFQGITLDGDKHSILETIFRFDDARLTELIFALRKIEGASMGNALFVGRIFQLVSLRLILLPGFILPAEQ